MPTYVVLIHSDPNNMNSIVYHLIIVRYSMKTLHWYFPWATALHLYNMTGRGGKLQQLHCYHPFSDSLDIYLTKNHYENYSPKMVPIAKIWGPGSWTIILKWRLKRLNTLSGLEICIQHQIVNALEVSTPPPPPHTHTHTQRLEVSTHTHTLPVISSNTLLTIACEYCRHAPSDFVTQGLRYGSHHGPSLKTCSVQFSSVLLLDAGFAKPLYLDLKEKMFPLFSAANLALEGFPQTNALGENLPSRNLNMFNLRLCNAATIRYSILKCGHMHCCGKGY